MKIPTWCTATLFATATAVIPTASAQSYIDFGQEVGGSGACQPALPAYEGVIRKRPLAIQNEGNSSAYITCAPHHTTEGDNWSLRVNFVNSSNAAKTVNCTIVSRNGSSAPEYATRSVSVPASGTANFTVYDADNLSTFGLVRATSCLLPPGTGIATLEVGGDAILEGAAG